MVFLLGAGPGGPEMLTRKAYRLPGCGVLLHDELVLPEIPAFEIHVLMSPPV